ncbi:MAG TPA: hypothetical protein VIZ30_03970, partial [Pseudomonadales bacterium]
MKPHLFLAPASLALSIASAATADVMIEQKMAIQGVVSLANMTSHTTTYIAGQRSRTDSTTAMESSLVRMFVRDGATTQIVQLDTDTVYELDLKKKQYTQTSLAAHREKLKKALEQSKQAQASQQQQAAGVDESQCAWTSPKSSVTKTGDTSTLAGYGTTRTTIAASQTCVDKSDPANECEFRLTLDQWLTPSFPPEQETLTYYEAYAKQLGLDSVGNNFAERAESMFGRYGGIWSELRSKMKEVRGHPLKSNLALAIGGPQCKKAKQTADDSSDKPSATDSVGRAIGGLFGGKKKSPEGEADAPKAAPIANPDGLIQLLSIGTETVSANQDPVDPQQFEVPAGFK